MSHTADHIESMSQWAPQRQMTLEQARLRSKAVGVMRKVFVAGAAISAGLMIGPIAANALTGGTTATIAITADEVITMVNPRFTGRNIAGESFEITADTARRQRSDPSVIDLTNPQMIDDLGTKVTAPRGVYSQNEAFLDLYEDVRLLDKDGYAFSTTAARVYVNEGRVEGLEPLTGSGPLGDVRSNNYEIQNDGERIVFKDCVYMTIYPGGRDAPENQIETISEGDENAKDSCGRPGRDYDYGPRP